MTIHVDVASLLHQAELVGEEMLHFRHGKELYTYCEHCSNAAVTPVTNITGCKMGDDAEVKEYSKRLYDDPDADSSEKCPGFTSTTDPEEVGFQNTASSRSGVMKKEVPGETVMPGRLSRESEGDLLNQEKRYRQNIDPLYDLTGREEEKKAAKTAAQDDVPQVDTHASAEELFQMLSQSGLSKNQSPAQQHQTVEQVLQHWQHGLLTGQMTPQVIDDIIKEFLATR